MGAILGLFRARREIFEDQMIRGLAHGLSFKQIFRILDTETRYAMPGTLRLYLREALLHVFTSREGEPMRLKDTEIPFISVVTGVVGDAAGALDAYKQVVQREMRRGAFGRLLHVKDLIQNAASLFAELVATPGALRPIALGTDPLTRDFDVLDAVGFSAAIPSIIQYDVTRDDPRMHELIQTTLDTHGVSYLTDGGLTANVPAQVAWEQVQSGYIGTRNAFVLGLDCFAPQMGRNVLFLPLQKLTAENVARHRPFAHMIFQYRKVPSPIALVPRPKNLDQAIKNGETEMGKEVSFLQKMLEVLPPIAP
jgi:hypothetical protein